MAIAAVAVVACRDDAQKAPEHSATALVASPAGDGCTPARPHAAGNSNETITSGGIERSYILHVPPQYDGSQAVPLVLNFHGFGSGATQQANYSRFPAKADEAGFIAVTPDGTGTPRRWNLFPTGQPDDIAFVRDLLDSLEANLCIDGKRVFVAGISNGAAFSMQLACAMPDRIAAAAAVAALTYPLRCTDGTQTGVIAFHGTADPCVPFTGGTSACGLMLPVAPIETSALNWAKHDGCNQTPSVTQLTEHVRVTAYSECRDNVSVVLYVVDGGGHTWPGSIDVARLGPTTHEIDATDLIWEYFVGQGNLR
ncbi:MAG TPA: PHB depolymerase family esterase [Dehalococcoidia bacterium]